MLLTGASSSRRGCSSGHSIQMPCSSLLGTHFVECVPSVDNARAAEMCLGVEFSPWWCNTLGAANRRCKWNGCTAVMVRSQRMRYGFRRRMPAECAVHPTIKTVCWGWESINRSLAGSPAKCGRYAGCWNALSLRSPGSGAPQSGRPICYPTTHQRVSKSPNNWSSNNWSKNRWVLRTGAITG